MIPQLSADLLRAASHLFALRGYAATTTREVARAARVDVATVYYHFKSKETLLRAVLAPLAVALAAAVTSAEKERDPAHRRDELVGALVDIQAQHAETVAVLNDPSLETVPEAVRSLRELDQRVVALLAPGKSVGDRDDARAALAALRSYGAEALSSSKGRERAEQTVLRMLAPA